MLATLNSLTQSVFYCLREYAGCRNYGQEIQKGTHQFTVTAPLNLVPWVDYVYNLYKMFVDSYITDYHFDLDLDPNS